MTHTTEDREYTREEMREACRNNYNAGFLKGKESQITTGRCASCAHWQREWGYSKEWEFGSATGLCTAFGSRKHSPHGDELKKMAFPFQGGEQFMGSLATRPEFGCVVWEARPAGEISAP